MEDLKNLETEPSLLLFYFTTLPHKNYIYLDINVPGSYIISKDFVKEFEKMLYLSKNLKYE